MNNKFVGAPRHALDLQHQIKVSRRLDSLLNGRIVDLDGNEIGKIFYSDGNTVFQVQASAGVFIVPEATNYVKESSYRYQQLVYVQPDDALIDDGTTDPDSLENVKASSGWWLCINPAGVQPVIQPDPDTLVPTAYYRIPHEPLPTPDDMEAENNYWAPFGSAAGICPPG